MTEFKKLLDDVIKGNGNLAPIRTWLDRNLGNPDCDHAALLDIVEQAEQAGLALPVAHVLRTHIGAAKPAAPASDAPADDFPFSLEPLPESSASAAEKTVMNAPPASADKTQISAPQDPEKTQVTAPGHEATRPAADDRTQQSRPPRPEDADATISMSTTGGKTVVTQTDRSGNPEDATTRTRGGAAPSGEFDPFALDNAPTGGRSTPTGSSWKTSTGLKASGGSDNLGVGSVLKDRFELTGVLGEGGMGKVYKARDLLKVEAKDKNPYIAVKTLSGDFKQHPESFIALQRESSKAQRLAHPNIATVFDFDRDGGTVYMTMELMEGEELARYIKHLPAGGLPVNEAMNLIKQLCDGLSYAHSKGLVHSDFKPGNAFLLKDGTLKLLDFGIARASKTKRDASGETTVFDPGQLGALTPAYATVEMFDGQDPDPRDDIYALACVSYELLTGKHPFNKLSAPKVLEKGLKPVPIGKLDKRQNRALMRALAIKRDDRAASVEEFWEGLRPKKSYTKQYAIGGIIAVLIIVGLGYKPVVDYLQTRRNNQLLAQIESGSLTIPNALKEIALLDPDSQRSVLDSARDRVIKYFEQQAETLVDETKGHYSYAAALKEIDTASGYYTDSAELAQYRASLNNRLNNLVLKINDQFQANMKANRLMPVEGEDITDDIKILKVAAPDNALLNNAVLIGRYADMIRQDVKASSYQQADQILGVALNYAPKDAELLNLRDQVKRELKREQDAQQIAQLEAQIKAAAPQLRTLGDFAKVREAMLKLHALNPGNAQLQKLNGPLKNALQSALNAAAAQKQWAGAEQSLYAYSHLLSVQDLLAQREALSKAEVQAGYVPADMQTRLNQVQQHRDAIGKMLASIKYDSDWDAKLLGTFQETIALLQPNDMTWFATLRDSIARSYIKLAEQMAQQDRFDAAGNLLDSGRSYAPELPDFDQAKQMVAQLQDKFQKAQAERQRLAQVANMENTFQLQTKAGKMGDADKTFAALQQQLPATDKFFTETAPKLYAMGYLGLANNSAVNGNYSQAVTFVQAGMKYAALDELKKALADYSNQAARAGLLAMVDSLQAGDMDKLRARLAQVQKLFPKEESKVEDSLLKKLAQRIEGLKNSGDLVTANDLLNAAKQVFTESSLIQRMTLPKPQLPSKFAKLGREAMAKNALTAAHGYFDQGQKQEAGNADLKAFGNQLQAAQAKANQYYVAYQQSMRSGQTSTAKEYLAYAMKLWTDNPTYEAEYKRSFATAQTPVRSSNGGRPCTAELAGYGRQGRAECFDNVGSARGPTMVVVPAGGGNPSFAIGKYEVSTGQWNDYCRASGQCTPAGGDAAAPATNIPYSQVQKYIEWLSAKSGAHYFLPTYAQWKYAASAGGSDSNRDFNCQVTLGGQVIKGLSMVNIETGRANAWGLTNYLGNAQEWVRNGGGVAAAGGDYQDPLSQCSPNLLRPGNGAADPLTGFRVARDLNQ
ncbi:MAG TPA: bifunctional serine/threonine-protein kinase/formylglycine-generating enzyme family protein [Gammaproteobacteria bacterium]|nr:bifunctional serine/threonine-protein kinase/formylglycine-generating enzyme family protein [Gammaproteobacteria bacterium]